MSIKNMDFSYNSILGYINDKVIDESLALYLKNNEEAFRCGVGQDDV